MAGDAAAAERDVNSLRSTATLRQRALHAPRRPPSDKSKKALFSQGLFSSCASVTAREPLFVAGTKRMESEPRGWGQRAPEGRESALFVARDKEHGERSLWPGTKNMESSSSICERFLGSVRRECFDHVIILSERRSSSHSRLRPIAQQFGNAGVSSWPLVFTSGEPMAARCNRSSSSATTDACLLCRNSARCVDAERRRGLRGGHPHH